MGGTSPGHRLRTFRALAGNSALVRVVAAYTLFTLIEYSVWLGMLVYAYSHGGATIASLVAIAQLVPAAAVAPFTAVIADRRSPVFLLAGGYLAQVTGTAAAAAAVVVGVPVVAYAAAVIATAAATGTRPAQAALIPSVATTPDQLTAANVLVGWVEAAGFATSGLMAGALIALGGVAAVFAVCAGLGLGVAAVLPLAAAAGGRRLFSLDAEAPVPVVEISLLRSLSLFTELPGPAIEALAASLTPVELPAGTVLIRQGEPGDAYYAIAAGELDTRQDGRFLRRLGRGEGVGEIALLHSIPRTATVTAHSAATVYQLDREPFLSAVLGHAQTYREASRIAGARLAAGATADGLQGPSPVERD